MSMNIRFPNITAERESEQINQIKSYLHQLVEQLNWALSTLESGSGSSSQQESSFGDVSAETFYELKSLLIQSSDTLNAYYKKINTKLEGQYVKQEDFDNHRESVNRTLSGLDAKYLSKTDFDAYKTENAQIIADLDKKFVLQADFDAYGLAVDAKFNSMQQEIDKINQTIQSMQETGGEELG